MLQSYLNANLLAITNDEDFKKKLKTTTIDPSKGGALKG